MKMTALAILAIGIIVIISGIGISAELFAKELAIFNGITAYNATTHSGISFLRPSNPITTLPMQTILYAVPAISGIIFGALLIIWATRINNRTSK